MTTCAATWQHLPGVDELAGEKLVVAFLGLGGGGVGGEGGTEGGEESETKWRGMEKRLQGRGGEGREGIGKGRGSEGGGGSDTRRPVLLCSVRAVRLAHQSSKRTASICLQWSLEYAWNGPQVFPYHLPSHST